MTACVNKHTGRVAAVVTASLVGALSLGAPAVALAQNNGIETLIAGDIEDVAKGQITAYTDQDGKAVDSTEFVANGKAQYLVPTEVTTHSGAKLKVQDNAELIVTYYQSASGGKFFIDADGNKVYIKDIDASNIKDADTYYVGVRKKGSSSAAENTFLKFTIVNKSLKGATVVDAKDATDTTIEYTATDLDFDSGLGIALDGKLLEKDTDYTVKLFPKGETSEKKAKNVGEYIARLEGAGLYKGSSLDVPFTVSKLDLTNVAVELNHGYGTVTIEIPTVNKVAGSTAYQHELGVFFKSSDNGDLIGNSGKPGTYTFTLQAKPGSEANFTGSQDITFVRYGKDATFAYDGKTVSGSTEDLGAKGFDPAKLSVKGDKKDLTFSVSYTKDGKVVTEDQTKLPGKYTAIVTANDDTYAYGGQKTFKFEVKATEINGKDIFVTKDGKLVTNDGITCTYDGTNVFQGFEVKATDVNGKEVPAGELVLEVTKGDKAVESVVDAGTYKVTVKAKDGSMYHVKDANSFNINVEAVKPVSAKLNNLVKDNKGTFYFWTGSEITPSATFFDAEGKAVTVPADAYQIKVTNKQNKVVSIKDEGAYTVSFVNTGDNYDVDDLSVKVDVKKVSSFADVDASAWYAPSVWQAKQNAYIKGVEGTNVFNPESNISRVDSVVIITRMAGVDGFFKADGTLTDAGLKYAQKAAQAFSDVDVNAYYAPALGWANEAGIANGSNGQFRPNDTISREEFAALLSNYAKSQGADITVDTDAILSEANGAETVSTWARDAVAWAKANGVMGNNGASLDGQGAITRAQTAAMAVNYQPEAK